MKFNSVKFFKALIIFILLLLIVVPTAFAVFFGIKYYQEKRISYEMSLVNGILVNDYVELAKEKNKNLPQYSQAQGGNTTQTDASEGEQAAMPEITPSFTYQVLYPHLYVDTPPGAWEDKEKVCYLTFDDGPSATTGTILQALEKNDVLATFFVTGKASELNEDTLRKAALAGHTIGVHTWSHDYNEIYASVEAYLEDFNKMYLRILEVTGKAPTVFRFAGGSINAYNQTVYNDIIAEMTRRGFVFYDWNASASDAVSGGISKSQVYQNVIGSAGSQSQLVVLMHDRNDTASTAAALPDIIQYLRNQGYTFEPLTNTVKPVTYFSLQQR